MSQQNVAGAVTAAAGGLTRPFDTDFQQQRLKAWMPTLTPRWVLTAYILIGVIFIPIGAALLYASQTVREESVRYDDAMEINKNGTVTITISHDMQLPVYFYYKLSGYYQNHRRYAASRSDEQLHGESSPDLSYCTPSRHKYADGGKVIYPCGMIAWTLFNDTYTVTMTRDSTTYKLGNSTDPNEVNPFFRKRGIAYSEDVTTRYKNHTYDNAVQPFAGFPSVQDEDFAVWMRVAGLPTFKKLHRIIGALPNNDNKLLAGDVITIEVQNRFPVAEMKAEKYIVLSTTSWLGGKSYFMGGAWIAVGLACFLMASGLALKTYIHPPPELDSDIAGAGDGNSFEIPNVSARLVRGARASSGADEAEKHEEP